MKTNILSGFALTAAAMMVLTGCDDVFEPAPENILPADYIEKNASYAEGMLGVSYMELPCWNMPAFSEVGTDDAVSNDADNSFRVAASGRWTSQNNPINRWENCRMGINYCNQLLEGIPGVTWADDPVINELFAKRFEAEARGLRALHMYFLLQAHGGYDNAGNLLGVPVITYSENSTSDNLNVARNTFKECVQAIRDDISAALAVLPTRYGSSCFEQMRSRFPGVSDGILERVFGNRVFGRLNGEILEAFLARTALLAASPAFEASDVTWAEAANLNAKLVEYAGGVNALDDSGLQWYNDGNIENYADTDMPADIFWRSRKDTNASSLEKDNFPPTLYGNGRVNPTQNFVDAFPMVNGYPISDLANSGYNSADPYTNRDPRLKMYVLVNGEKAGNNNSTITTAIDGTTNDALGKTSTSTRTGYYLKKHLRQDVNLDPSATQGKPHYTARLRYTEFFLNYAEAANEAWGPTGSGSNGFSAYDVIKKIRNRAGIGLENGDAYLESVKTNKDAMRELIRNERRLELCFEGFRFYDLRRWKAPLNETAQGISISSDETKVIDVETRNYRDHMYYGPIPYSEILKFSALQQNKGW